MATKKTNKRSTKKVDGVDYKINDDVTITCYNWGKNCSCKITLLNSFVIYARICEDKKGNYFLSYPAYENDKGEWKKLAYCFDKDIIAEINDSIDDFMSE